VVALGFVVLDEPALSAHRIHLQLYPFNDLMLRAVAARVRLPEAVAARALAPLLGRLLYLQGYLHSDDSARIACRLDRDGTLAVSAPPPDATRPRQVLRALRRLGAGLEPLSPLLQAWPAAKGFHHGGSFPMGSASDLLGRPHGLERVHLVDASVLPTVPAQTITLPVMANAHRIATHA
jgi:choline dehydrogenase-like flavoprotein